MLTVATNKTNDVDVDKAIKRMQAHASKSRSSFAKALKVKAPKSVYGCLAGPAKAQKNSNIKHRNCGAFLCVKGTEQMFNIHFLIG